MNTTGAKEALEDLKETGSDMVDQLNEAGQRLGRKANNAAREAKRNLHKLQDSTEDAIDETKHAIRKNPIKAVAVAVGIGVGVGILVGYVLGSKDSD